MTMVEDPQRTQDNLDSLDSEAFVNRALHHVETLEQSQLDAIRLFKERSNSSGYLHLRNVPVGLLPATPPSPTSLTTKDDTSELSLLGIAAKLGEPVGYLPELGGRIVQNLVPVESNAQVQTSTSSSVTLMWHTETAFHPFKPRYLVLLCLKGEPGAQTLLCSIDSILDSLSPETVEVLSQPRFRVAPDRSFRSPLPIAESGSRELLGPLTRVLNHTQGDLEFTYDADLMVGVDGDATNALRELQRQIDLHHTGVELTSGDLLIVDNHRAVHGRSAFTARFDGTDRWLQRTFVVSHLAPSAHERVGRTITTTF